MEEGDRGDGCGCLLVVGAGVAIVILIVLGAIFGKLGADHDDPYFQQAAPCSIPVGSLQPQPVVITNAGMSPHCVLSYDLPVSFTNRLSGQSVTLCLGRAGVCVAGHSSPFPGGRLTMRPGESEEVTFRSGRRYGFGFDREYPVTVAASAGTPSSAAFDLIVQAKANEPPSSP